MTAPKASAQPAAEPLPRREPGKGLAALLPAAADRTGDAPAPGDEPAVAGSSPGPEPGQPAPEPGPKWPPIEPALSREFPRLAGPAPDAFAGLMAFNGMAAAAGSAIDGDEQRGLDAGAEILRHFDRAHMETRSQGWAVPGDVCAYASAAGLARCPVHGVPQDTRAAVPVWHHEPHEIPTGWYPALPPLSAGELPEYGVMG